MAQYIEKSAIFTKIDDLIGDLRYNNDDEAPLIDMLIEVKNFINTLETKEIEIQ